MRVGHGAIRPTATIGLGRAVLSRITDGIPWTALRVNSHRPRSPGRTWVLSRILLRKHGIDPRPLREIRRLDTR
jgi:hypothetical protein